MAMRAADETSPQELTGGERPNQPEDPTASAVSEGLTALVDFLTFTVPAGMYPADDPAPWARRALADLGIPDNWDFGGGQFGYRQALWHQDIPGCWIGWGSELAAGTLYVCLPGTACQWIPDWRYTAEILETLGARVTRVDLAIDDYEGAYYSVDQAREDYAAGLFILNGRPPKKSYIEDDDGRSFYVGRRPNGKFLRVYEKGRQLGDPDSQWVRVELEIRNRDRQIPYDTLYRPAEYVAGAYPALSWAANAVASLRTLKKKTEQSVMNLFRHARQAYGKVVRMLVEECGQDPALVALSLIRDGVPGSLRGTPEWGYPEMGS